MLNSRTVGSGRYSKDSSFGWTDGVGKTTTIAKLAANFSLVAKKKVGLVTIDTYRIAAVEQLKTYADIIGVPVKGSLYSQELQTNVECMADMDLILIDTADVSQHNRMQITELKRCLEVLT